MQSINFHGGIGNVEFDINECEAKRAQEFVDRHQEKSSMTLAVEQSHFQVIFEPTGIGTFVTMRNVVLEVEENITDLDKF